MYTDRSDIDNFPNEIRGDQYGDSITQAYIPRDKAIIRSTITGSPYIH